MTRLLAATAIAFAMGISALSPSFAQPHSGHGMMGGGCPMMGMMGNGMMGRGGWGADDSSHEMMGGQLKMRRDGGRTLGLLEG